MDKKIKDKVIVYSKVSGAILGFVTLSTLASSNYRVNAIMGKIGAKVISPSKSAVSKVFSKNAVSSKVIKTSNGRNLVAETRVIGGGDFNVDPETKIVSFTDLKGNRVSYKEERPFYKLSIDPKELEKHKYLNDNGKESVYFGVKKNRIVDGNTKGSGDGASGVTASTKIVKSSDKTISQKDDSAQEDPVKKSTQESLKMLQRLKKDFGEKKTIIPKSDLDTIEE